MRAESWVMRGRAARGCAISVCSGWFVSDKTRGRAAAGYISSEAFAGRGRGGGGGTVDGAFMPRRARHPWRTGSAKAKAAAQLSLRAVCVRHLPQEKGEICSSYAQGGGKKHTCAEGRRRRVGGCGVGPRCFMMPRPAECVRAQGMSPATLRVDIDVLMRHAGLRSCSNMVR